jgi:hypothetical protein
LVLLAPVVREQGVVGNDLHSSLYPTAAKRGDFCVIRSNAAFLPFSIEMISSFFSDIMT